MSTLLKKALERIVALPQDEQDPIASQILASLADEDGWKKRFAEKRDVIRHMAWEALKEDEMGETLPLDDLPDHPPVLAFSGLPFEAQQGGKRAFRLFQSNPAHPVCNSKNWIGERPHLATESGTFS